MITFTYNKSLKRIASAGSDGIKVIDTKDFKEIRADAISPADIEDGRVTDLCWSPDGQILSIATSAGNVYNFLAKMNTLSTKYKTSIAYLSSLREVSVVDVGKRSRVVDVTVKIEPQILALGAKHVAAGMNNKVFYHRIVSSSSSSAANQQVLMIF